VSLGGAGLVGSRQVPVNSGDKVQGFEESLQCVRARLGDSDTVLFVPELL
jgi:hypothetical protein